MRDVAHPAQCIILQIGITRIVKIQKRVLRLLVKALIHKFIVWIYRPLADLSHFVRFTSRIATARRVRTQIRILLHLVEALIYILDLIHLVRHDVKCIIPAIAAARSIRTQIRIMDLLVMTLIYRHKWPHWFSLPSSGGVQIPVGIGCSAICTFNGTTPATPRCVVAEHKLRPATWVCNNLLCA